MNAIKNKKIAIVGGGPGGLTLARLLQLKGADVTVYERDLNRDVRVQGATLDLHYESGLAALAQAGLMDAFNASYRPGADKLCIANKHAQVMLDEIENAEAGNPEHFRPEIDRGPLRDLLLDSLAPGTVVWNSQFKTMARSKSGWLLEFQDGNTAAADLVIAADGANSKIRPLITPIKAFYSGVTVVEGSVSDSAAAVPNIHRLLAGGKIFALGDDKTLIVSSKGDGSLVFYTGCKTSEDWMRSSGVDFSDRASVTKWFRESFSGWDPLWLGLFENASLPFVPRPQYCMPLNQQWEAQPDLTMLGDAAHVMPPYAGEGVNMAMLDALELSKALTDEKFADAQAALAHYETLMRARASETAKMTLEQTEAMHSPAALSNMLALFGK